jgi:cell division protein ZapA (FtsZ GTPase activity inhibitor)
MAENLCKIELLGTTITVRTEEDLHYIKQLERSVAETISQVRTDLSLGDPMSMAIMAAIYLADENFRLKRQAPVSNLQNYPASFNGKEQEIALMDINSLLDRVLKK